MNLIFNRKMQGLFAVLAAAILLPACMANNTDSSSSAILVPASSSNTETSSAVSSADNSSEITSPSTSSASSKSTIIRGDLVVAINAGGPATTLDEVSFDADKYSRGGSTYTTTDPITGTNDDALFQSERWGEYSYEVPVSKATYDIALYFSEIFITEPDTRIFSIRIEGQTVINNFDLFATAGHDTAYQRIINNISVDDGSLSITLIANKDNPKLSGFAIYSGQGVLEEPTYPIVNASNPNIWADVPDMSILRVGDTYYMSSTTMHLSPGVPIMKSTDLKNWEVINYAYQNLGPNNNAMNLNNGENAYSRGTWASSISYRDGIFYVSSFSYTTGKTYVWTTNNIEGGSWTEYRLKEANGRESGAYHDSSLFFDDDGKVYLVHAPGGSISILELTGDATSVAPGATDRRVVQNAHTIAANPWPGGLTAEGTQMQKINGWYYISNICWPSGGPRTQIVHRSRNIYGPYEGRVVLREGVAQGRFVEAPSGDWYLYAFKDSGAVGRIPYLVPITWQNEWPVGNTVPNTLNFEVEDRGMQGLVRNDEFNNRNLDIVWQWNHNPDDTGWSLNQRAGFLRITNTRIDSNILNTRNTLTQRMFGPTSTGTIKLDTRGMKNGDIAGISAFGEEYGLVGVRMNNGQKMIIMINNDATYDHREIESQPFNQDIIYLRAHGDFRNNANLATFAYSLDGIRWNDIGNTTRMRFDHQQHFMGYKFGLFNYSTQSTGGYVDFDYFHVTD